MSPGTQQKHSFGALGFVLDFPSSSNGKIWNSLSRSYNGYATMNASDPTLLYVFLLSKCLRDYIATTPCAALNLEDSDDSTCCTDKVKQLSYRIIIHRQHNIVYLMACKSQPIKCGAGHFLEVKLLPQSTRFDWFQRRLRHLSVHYIRQALATRMAAHFRKLTMSSLVNPSILACLCCLVPNASCDKLCAITNV